MIPISTSVLMHSPVSTAAVHFKRYYERVRQHFPTIEVTRSNILNIKLNQVATNAVANKASFI